MDNFELDPSDLERLKAKGVESTTPAVAVSSNSSNDSEAPDIESSKNTKSSEDNSSFKKPGQDVNLTDR